jgi:serine protease Do
MPNKPLLKIALPLLILSSLYPQDKPKIAKIHTGIYRKVAPAVVGVSYGTQNKGSGVIIDKSGIVLTSTVATGLRVRFCYVYTHGDETHRRIRAKVLKVVKEKDLVILRLERQENLHALELGDSDKIKVGEISYVLGDSFGSIFEDGQVAFSLGVINGIYKAETLRKSRMIQESEYKGDVIETSAAVNPNQAGAPLIDAEGRLIGLILLSYDASRFVGLAVPINKIKPELEGITR